MTGEPLISVVVPTRNRPDRLARLLCSLNSQQLPPHAFEVIVVDDASGPATRQLLQHQQQSNCVQLRWLRRPVKGGPAAARNCGWRLARAPLVGFTDDDCTATAGWLSAALAAHRADPLAVIQGRTEPDPAELGTGDLLSRTIQVQHLGPQYETCNIFYPWELLQRLGGFDERFGRRPAAEDTDLAWRAIEAGRATRFADDAVVFHAVERLTPREMLALASRWGAATRIFATHPQTRSMLYGRTFWNVWHYLMWRSLVALMLPTPLRRLVLSRHLLALRQRAREGGRGPATIPFLVLHDAVECASVAAGALQHRTLVL